MKRKRKPGWAKKTTEGRRMFRWLRRRKEQTLTERGWQFIKVYHCPFIFVYGQTAEKERYVCRDFQFLAIFNMDTWELTDVSYQLRSFLEIPENQKFRFQQKCKRQAEREIQKYAIKLLGEEEGWKEKAIVPWKRTSVLCRYRDWIRKEAEIQAAGGEESERFKEDIRINRILKEAVEQEKIRYQEERRERIALITRIREAVKGIDDEVAVITEAGNGTYDVFHMEPEILRNFLGVYPISTISGKEKRDRLKKYGKDKVWDITEIWKVGIRNRWLYEAEKSGISDAA